MGKDTGRVSAGGSRSVGRTGPGRARSRDRTQHLPAAPVGARAARSVAQLPAFFLFHPCAVTGRDVGRVAAAASHPSMPGDVNEDGVVDLEDLLMVTADLGPPPFGHPRADVNGDGAVDIGDLVAVAANLGRGAPGTAVAFPDANLEAAVRQALAKPAGTDITVQDLQGLTELVAADRGMEDLTGLEHATNLQTLELGINQISDLTPLSGLISLQRLRIFTNQINDLAPLSGLTNLQGLNLGGNQVSDLTPLSALTNMSELALWDNNISDLASLSSLTNLRFLDLGGNLISGLAPLTRLTNLEGLGLSFNKVRDLAPLSALTSLRELDVSGNQINNIQPLVDNEGLGEGDVVDLRANPLSEESLNIHIPQLEGS